MYRSCLFHKCHQGKVRDYPPGPYLYQLWKRKLWKRDSKNSHLWPCEKREKNPSILYYVLGMTLHSPPSCNIDERQVFLLPSSHGKTEARRSMGPQCQGKKREVVPCLHPGFAWSHRHTCRFERVRINHMVSSCPALSREKKALKCCYVWLESRSLHASLSAVTVCLPLHGAEGQFKSSEVPRAPSASPSETGIFCSFFFFKSWFGLSVFVLQPSSPDANTWGKCIKW